MKEHTLIGRGKGLLPRKWRRNGGGGGGKEDGDGVAPSVPLVFFQSLICNELIN